MQKLGYKLFGLDSNQSSKQCLTLCLVMSNSTQPRQPVLMHSAMWLKCVFLLQQDNIICQALLDFLGESSNPCTIYSLLMVPLDTLTVTYHAYKNWITQFQDMYDCCNSQIPFPLDNLIVTYGGTSTVQPLSNAYKNGITQF
jgi:hypothetical protein